MSDVVISVEGLGKRYIIGHQAENGGYVALRDVFMQNARTIWYKTRDLAQGKAIIQGDTLEEVWALKDVTFEIRRGEAVGIIGRNGAGKSTLLKILSRITEPSAGRVTIKGRMASLLEVGTGFHPELSGRENIYLNGAILGMTRAEIKRKFDEIVAFAGVETFLDTPVKRYSSGMYVRLAFAVAAHLEPEILVVDEVLAVGDAAFQKKCLGRMETIAREGRTVLFVSHNMAAIQSLCHCAHLLSYGQLDFSGETDLVIKRYLEDATVVALQDLRNRKDRSGDQSMKFTQLSLEDQSGHAVQEMVSGKDYSIVLQYESGMQLKDVAISIGIYGNHGQFLLMCNNEMTGQHFDALPAEGRIKCALIHLPFSQGTYHVNLYCEVKGVRADWVQDAAILTVVDGDFYGTGKVSPNSHGGFLAQQIWSLDQEH